MTVTHPTRRFLLSLVQTANRHPVKTPPAGIIIAKLIASPLDADQDWHTRPNHPQVSEVLTLIDQRHTDPTFDTKDIARHIQNTPHRLELLLDEQYGGTRASEILLERRLVTAMTLLHPGTPQRAEDTASLSGFASISHLDTALSGVYGLDMKTLLAINPSVRE